MDQKIEITYQQFFNAAYEAFGIHYRGRGPYMGSGASVIYDQKFGEMAEMLGFKIPNKDEKQKLQNEFLNSLTPKSHF